MKTTVNKILEFCKMIQESTGEENPEINYNEVIKALFPFQWKLDKYYDRTGRNEGDDADCCCE
jgi:hypothetical protein